MKKYIKPELYFESFTLSQHIADCAWELTNTTKETCTAAPDQKFLQGETAVMFTDSTSACMLIPGKNYQDYCYTTGNDLARVFQS